MSNIIIFHLFHKHIQILKYKPKSLFYKKTEHASLSYFTESCISPTPTTNQNMVSQIWHWTDITHGTNTQKNEYHSPSRFQSMLSNLQRRIIVYLGKDLKSEKIKLRSWRTKRVGFSLPEVERWGAEEPKSRGARTPAGWPHVVAWGRGPAWRVRMPGWQPLVVSSKDDDDRCYARGGRFGEVHHIVPSGLARSSSCHEVLCWISCGVIGGRWWRPGTHLDQLRWSRCPWVVRVLKSRRATRSSGKSFAPTLVKARDGGA